MRKTSITIAFLTSVISLRAQDERQLPATPSDSLHVAATTDSLSKHHRHTYLEATLDYQNNNVYMGRKDSAVLPYFTPGLSYYHKSGFYATASAAWLKNADISRIDLVTIASGFRFSAGKYDGDFTASKYFYNTQSTSVTSEIQASMSYSSSYDLGWIRTTLSGQLNMGNNTDMEASLGMEHSFDLMDDALEITPTLTANAGTLNYYSNYYKTRRFNRKNAKKAVSGTVTITGTVVNPSAFKVLDYEASLPISFTAGKCTFSATPAFSIPVNPARINLQYAYSTGATALRQHVEKIENTFYWTLGAAYRF
ncbi:hypothetical protein Q4E93_30615 [Flavitalea sp. BT771]|uniref:hypothetical protein n=1 Tax=Flavitalea sp. BT771 TaxID=3063329 RepID=UPI0026E1CACC|nr:hypothetical protein [Flavitalea sp. BT771]MDO6435007.1 hypothetical protein [Flavitalea sp. BT771]MDV6223907.1 hypothetical protein [Flavitalea sp. BT771]